ATYPVESLDLDVGIIDLVDEPMLRRLRDHVAGPRSHRLVAQVLARRAPTVRHLPGIDHRGGIFTVPDHPAAIENESLQPVLGKLLGCPAAANAGADNDRVVRIALHQPPLVRLWRSNTSRHVDRMQIVEVYLRCL